MLYELVQNHVVQSSIAPSQLTNGFAFTNLNGEVGQVLGEPWVRSIEDANVTEQGTRRTTGTYVGRRAGPGHRHARSTVCAELLSGGAWGEHYVSCSWGDTPTFFPRIFDELFFE